VKPVFADTSFYAAFLSQRDVHHAAAVDLSANNRAKIVTTDFVVVELVNSFSQAAGRASVTDFVRLLRSDPNTTIVSASSDLMQLGFDLFTRRPDKEWSLTDCISFVVMEEHGITDALSSDRDFEQAGFVALLRA
jgi:hypothetical protein